MLIEYVALRGFHGLYKNGGSVEIRFPESGLIAIVGQNGSGKTTVIDNLHPYRFMPSRASAPSPRAFSFYDHTFGNAVKELVFTYRGKRFRAVIEIDNFKNKQSASIWEVRPTGEVPVEVSGIVSDGGVTTYDAIVEALFGPPQSYFVSVFIPQGRRLVTSLSPTVLRSIFVTALGVERARELHEKAKEVVREGEKRVEVLGASIQSSIASVRSALERKRSIAMSAICELDSLLATSVNIEEIERELRSAIELEQSLNSRLQAIRSELEALSKREKELRDTLELSKSRVASIGNSLAALSTSSDVEMRALKLRNEEAEWSKRLGEIESKLREQVQAARHSNAVLRAWCREDKDIFRIAHKLEDALKSTVEVPCGKDLWSRCPLYGQRNEFSQEEIREAMALVNSCIDTRENLASASQCLLGIQAELRAVELSMENHKRMKSEIARLSAERTQVMERISALQLELDSLPDRAHLLMSARQLSAELEVASKRKADLSSKLENAKSALYKLDGVGRILESTLLEVESLGKEVDAVCDNVAELKNMNMILEHDRILRSALSERGVQAMLLVRGVSSVESIANELLSRAFSGRYTVGFQFMRELKSGDQKIDFSLVLHDSVAGGQRDLSTLSGGESVMAMEALSRALVIHCFPDIHAIVEDESDGALDIERRAEIMSLKRAALSLGFVRQDIFVTHSREMMSSADYVLEAPLFL